MKVGMVIVNYNDYETTLKLVDNVINYKSLVEVVVVDNASTDNSVKVLKKVKNDKLTILEAKENKGYSAGLNIGAKYLIDKYKHLNIIFSNADIIVPSEGVIKDLNTVVSNQNVVVAPVIKEKDGVSRGWINPSPLREVLLNIPFFHRFFHKKIEYKEEHYKKPFSKVDVVSGCFFMVNAEHLKKIDYFDEKVFLYYEENILSVKTKRENKSIILDNNVSVIHNHSISVDKSVKRLKKYKLQKQSQYYFEKNYNNANIIERILLKLTYYFGYLVFSIYYLIK